MKVDKYSDDSWISLEALNKKIETLFPNTYNSIADEKELKVIGYFINEQEAVHVFSLLLENCKKAACSVNIINPLLISKPTQQLSKDFWNN